MSKVSKVRKTESKEWSVGVAVQGARRKVHGTEVKRRTQRKIRISNNNGISVNRVPCTVNRVPCTVSHLFQYSNAPLLQGLEGHNGLSQAMGYGKP